MPILEERPGLRRRPKPLRRRAPPSSRPRLPAQRKEPMEPFFWNTVGRMQSKAIYLAALASERQTGIASGWPYPCPMLFVLYRKASTRPFVYL